MSHRKPYSKQFDPTTMSKLVENSLAVPKESVQSCLAQSSWSIRDFTTLISPEAQRHLDTMTHASERITRQRFGNTMQLYIPLYLSNYCSNECLYCGFNATSKIPRKILSDDEIVSEALSIKSRGFQHILLLTGEACSEVGVAYLEHAIQLIKSHFASIGLEVFPMTAQAYGQMIQAGADSLTIYQETYNPQTYSKFHRSGLKADFINRLDTPDQAGQAGFYRVNLGALLGLDDWRYEAISLADHVSYLKKRYWKTKFSISLPRIQDMGTDFQIPNTVSDTELQQFICAFRMVFPDLGITLSTREPAELRDTLIQVGITAISAESHTAPGGYSDKLPHTGEQFKISDTRSLEDIQETLLEKGYEPVMRDWI